MRLLRSTYTSHKDHVIERLIIACISLRHSFEYTGLLVALIFFEVYRVQPLDGALAFNKIPASVKEEAKTEPCIRLALVQME